MKHLTTALLALGLVAIAASAARADTFACVNKSSGTPKIVSSCTVGTNQGCHNNDICVDLSSESSDTTCWQFIDHTGTNVFPTDSLKLTKESHENVVSGNYVVCVGGSSGSHNCPGGHLQVIPMVGTIQPDQDGNRRLMLDGRIWDTSLGRPQLFECTIADTLNPGDNNSLGCSGSPISCPSAGQSPGRLFAYCTGYPGFGVTDTGFDVDEFLEVVDCAALDPATNQP